MFELPVIGAKAYASVKMCLKSESNEDAISLEPLPSGTHLTILEEDGAWWKVECDAGVGYVRHGHCLINLPDVIPSMVYQNTNSTASIFTSSFFEIPNLTGEKMYTAWGMNPRFSEEVCYVPVLYAMAKKIALAQKLALENNQTIIMYEAYRPNTTQLRILNELIAFSETNPKVYQGISQEPWEVDWFIATGLSGHQMGSSMDVSLGDVVEQITCQSTAGECVKTTKWRECKMVTPMHELSVASASLVKPVPSRNDSDWRAVEPAEGMTQAGLDLRHYCSQAGLTPLASEWWHFNDLEAEVHPDSKGDFFLF